jgi:hypothetical protein
MPKAKLIFNLPEEQEEFDTVSKAGDFKSALWDVAQEVFRPARKHGYSDTKIQKELEDKDAFELVGLLEAKFYEILSQHNIEL